MSSMFPAAFRLVVICGLTAGCFVDPKERAPNPGPSDTGTESQNPDEDDAADLDSDGDGVADSSDCAPTDANVFPGAMEFCNGIDDDCDGIADNDAVDASIWYLDKDGDGFGSAEVSTESCEEPVGSWATDDSDCDDHHAALGSIDQDADCDGFLTVEDCDDTDDALPETNDLDCDGVSNADDCDDADPMVGTRVDDLDCDDVPTHAGGGDLIRISAGSFDMGCTEGQSYCDEDESTVMPVTLTRDYYMGETEVTQGEYESVMGNNPSGFDSCGEECPVERVTWHMAADFTNHLSESSGLTECYTCTGSGEETWCEAAVSPYDCDGYRLPTEAEWEGAARCGEDLLYAGSNTASEVAWYDSMSTMPVALKDANACDLFDMSGNVREWTNDWYDDEYYRSAGRTDPEGGPEVNKKVRRGGSYLHPDVTLLRVANRETLRSATSSMNQGFRIARTAD